MRSVCIWGGVLAAMASLSANSALGQVQRVMGLDVSYWNSEVTQANWNTARNTPDANGYVRQFAYIRASRGGTTGVDQVQGTPGGGSNATLSRRYDDPRFMQNMTRAVNSGMLTGAYHFGRHDVAGNTGTDEADHFIQAAGAWMRPGYLMPVFDLEGPQTLSANGVAQFSVDFSNRIYEVMQIRPGMYINGNYSSVLQSASTSLRNQLAQPVANSPSVVGPAYPMLWDARYANQNDPNSIPVQTGSPKTTPSTLSSYYGPWDDYGDSQPWSFWQYASTVAIPGFSDTTSDGNVSHGDIEYVRNYLVPAVWWNDSSGDWSAMTNWNSGQAVVAPVQAPGQAAPYSGGTLPIARLPGAAGSATTSGQYDTVILERPNANVTVTVSTGSHNVRKLYLRESLNITGGSLTINYDPTYRPDNNANVYHGGPISAQFSGAVTLGGSGSLNVHTLQVDATRTFAINGGNLTANKINLMPHASTPAKILLGGDLNFTPLSNAAAVIAKGAGSGASGLIDLGGANRTFNIGNGAAANDLTISVPVINGGITKTGVGTLALTGANTYGGDTNVEMGTLSVNSAMLANGGDVRLSGDGTLNLNFSGADVIDSLFVNGASQAVGTWGAIGSAAQFTTPFITGPGFLQVSKYLAAADFNLDGFVDAADLTIWRSGISNGGTTPAEGDANGDSAVDGLDFLVWQRQLTGNGPSPVASVPEPAALSLAIVVAAFLGAGRSRRTRMGNGR